MNSCPPASKRKVVLLGINREKERERLKECTGTENECAVTAHLIYSFLLVNYNNQCKLRHFFSFKSINDEKDYNKIHKVQK